MTLVLGPEGFRVGRFFVSRGRLARRGLRWTARSPRSRYVSAASVLGVSAGRASEGCSVGSCTISAPEARSFSKVTSRSSVWK